MPKDDLNYKFTENGIVYDFYDVFVPAENFRQPALWVMGSNAYGQLGINVYGGNRNTPVTTFVGGTTWKQVSCGREHTAAIKTDGSLWVWGYNNQAQLGTNDTASKSIPSTTFAGGMNWKSVSCGFFHTAAIKTDGTLWTWGSNGSGRIGVNDNNDGSARQTPVTTFAGGNNWKSVECGSIAMAAIKTDGSLWTWGGNAYAQLGINQGNVTIRTPVTTFAGGNDWKQVSVGAIHVSAIKTDGTLWTWGNNGAGRLGIDQGDVNISTPVTTFAGGNNWKQVSAGGGHTGAIKTDGSLWTWGLGTSGQLGNFVTTDRSTPVTTFVGGNNWKSVASGNENTGAIKTDGSLWTWGLGTSGELGNFATTNRSTPVTTFAGGNNWNQVSCELRRTAAIKYQPDP